MYATDSTHGHATSTSEFIQDLKIWWANCPLFTRCVMIFSAFICFLSLVSDIAALLVNIPQATIGSLDLTRLFYSPFTFFTPAELLLGFLAYIPLCAEQEKAVGTLKTATDFFFRNFEINLFFIIICYLLSLIPGLSIFRSFSAYGLWGIYFAQLVEKCLHYSEGNVSFLNMPFQIQTKYYPLALLILFSVISNIIRFDIVVASFVGFLHYKFLGPLYNSILNDRLISSWETSVWLSWIRTLPHYTSLGTVPGGLIDSHNHSGIVEFGHSGTPPGSQGGFKGFGGNRNYAQVEHADIEDLSHDIEKP